MSATSVWIEQAALPSGWAGGVRLELAGGVISRVEMDVRPRTGEPRLSIVIPGLCNLHSHAFQRGMAGLAEARTPAGDAGGDSFWSWREVMYRFLDRLDPDGFQAIAEMAYVEMLESGFTRVGEFHYLHHAPDGRPYADPAEMSLRVAAAAGNTGIGLTLLPVFYAHSGFGGRAPEPGQKRFVHDIDGYARLLETMAGRLVPLGDAVLGMAPHSLRAVAADELRDLPRLNAGPIHIHIAEQQKEVEACLAWSGQRPVQWLLAHAEVDARWCLVHATHVLDDEVQCMAARGAVVGLCPITEANLGDGLFPAADYLRAGGRFGIGSDSNVLIDAAEELRLLEYGQRLQSLGRNVLAIDGRSTGASLFRQAVSGGAQALGVSSGLQPGASADWIELDANAPALHARAGDQWLDSWVFAARNDAIASVWRKGIQLVERGRHHRRDEVVARFRHVLDGILTTR